MKSRGITERGVRGVREDQKEGRGGRVSERKRKSKIEKKIVKSEIKRNQSEKSKRRVRGDQEEKEERA